MNENLLLIIVLSMGIIVSIALLVVNRQDNKKLIVMAKYNFTYSEYVKDKSFEDIDNDGANPCEQTFDLPYMNYYGNITEFIEKDKILNATYH